VTRTLTTLLIAGAIAGAALADRSPAGPNAVAIERTLLCETAFTGGLRDVTVWSHAGTGRKGAQWKRPAYAAVTTGQAASAFTLLDPSLAWITAGRPARNATVVQDPYANATYPFRAWGTVSWNVRLCNESSARVSLDAKGLSGGASGPFDDAYDCPTPRRVLLRFRAAPSAAAKAGSYRQFLRYVAPFTKAQLVVATDAGRKLAYAEVLASGKTHLLAAKSCSPGG
jgi:hypothetical protein